MFCKVNEHGFNPITLRTAKTLVFDLLSAIGLRSHQHIGHMKMGPPPYPKKPEEGGLDL